MGKGVAGGSSSPRGVGGELRAPRERPDHGGLPAPSVPEGRELTGPGRGYPRQEASP